MKEIQSTKEAFVKARKQKKKIFLTYFSGEYNLFLTKLCIPVQQVHPVTEFESYYYYFWDEKADVGDRLFGLPRSEIKYIELTEEDYDPNDYILPDTNNV